MKVYVALGDAAIGIGVDLEKVASQTFQIAVKDSARLNARQ